MKKSAEKIGQLLNYEKLSGISLLRLPEVEKEDVPKYIECPKYERAMGKLDTKMERYRGKVDRLTNDLRQVQQNIEEQEVDLRKWKRNASTFLLDRTNVRAVERQNNAADNYNRVLEKRQSSNEKHAELIGKIKEAEEEANEALEELTLAALAVIDEDIALVVNRLEDVASNFANSDDADDLLASIDVCMIGLRVYAMFGDLIEDNSALKECKEGIEKVNKTLSTLCAKDSIQNYMADIYRRNLDVVQKNAAIDQQINGVLASVDQKLLDTHSQSIDAVLAVNVNTKFDYNSVIDPAEIDKIVVNIKDAIDSLKLNIEKAKACQTVTPAIELGKTGTSVDQQAKSLKDSMQANVDALDGPLTQSHFAVQIIDEAVIEDFYQKDTRVAVIALRKHIVDTIGEENFECVLKGGDDRFLLKKGQDAIDKANLTRLQSALDKIPCYINELTEQITSAESDIENANKVPLQNADALSAELGTTYGVACVPIIGFFAAIAIHGRVKTFEPAFRSTNQIYIDLGNTLLEKNKKMNIIALMINLGFGIGSLIYFLVNGGPIVISVIALATYIITCLMLIKTGKKLESYLWEGDIPQEPMIRFLYIDANRQRQGPIDGEQFRELMAQGVIVPTTLVKAETGWQGTAGEIPVDLLPKPDTKFPYIVANEQGKRQMEVESPAPLPVSKPSAPTKVEEFRKNAYHEIPAKVLKEMIQRTIFAVDYENLKDALGGVCFETVDDNISVVATDSRRLAWQKGEGRCINYHKVESAVVPVTTLQELERKLERAFGDKSISDDDDVKMAVDGDTAWFHCKHVTLEVRLIKGRFPKWRSIIPNTDGVSPAKIDCGTLLHAIQEVQTTTTDDEPGIDFIFSSGKLTLQVRNRGAGKRNVNMHCSYDGITKQVKIDLKFMTSFLRVLESSAILSIFPPSDNDGPVKIITEDCNYTYVVMPMCDE